MSKDKKDNPGHDFVTPDLCEVYREVLTTKIDSIKTIIIVTVSISTTIISAVMWILKMQG